jgi:hypothetical protein
MRRSATSNCYIAFGIFLLVILFALAGPVHAEGVWQSDLITGCRAWNPAPQPNEVFSWRGDCNDGYIDGYGILYWIVDGIPGRKEKATFMQGKKYGQGIVTWPTGERYEGNYYDGLKNGWGIYTWANGDRYKGQWLNDKRTGKGVLTWVDGSRYEGDFYDNKMQGYGVYMYADGRLVRGRFENNAYVGP